MGYFVYILQSESTQRYYCGSTSDVERRLKQHNDPGYRSNATTRRFHGHWKVVHVEEFPTRSAAMLREKRIKGRGIGRYLGSKLS